MMNEIVQELIVEGQLEMRFIDLERLEELEDWPPESIRIRSIHHENGKNVWIKPRKSCEMRQTSKTRSKIFSKYSDLWSDVRIHLRTIHTTNVGTVKRSTHRLPGDIDHYRPKGAVAETRSRWILVVGL